jgi:hypothetical protein
MSGLTVCKAIWIGDFRAINFICKNGRFSGNGAHIIHDVSRIRCFYYLSKTFYPIFLHFSYMHPFIVALCLSTNQVAHRPRPFSCAAFVHKIFETFKPLYVAQVGKDDLNLNSATSGITYNQHVTLLPPSMLPSRKIEINTSNESSFFELSCELHQTRYIIMP